MRNKSDVEKGFNEFLGSRLKELRSNIGASMEYVAEAIGCSRQNYYLYETGENGVSSFMLRKIASFYNINIDVLLSNKLILEFPVTRFDRYKIDEFGIVKPVDKIKISNPFNSMYIIEREKDYLVMQTVASYVENTLMVIEYKGSEILSKVYRATNLKENHILIEVNGNFISVPIRSVYFISYLVAKIVKSDDGHLSFLV